MWALVYRDVHHGLLEMIPCGEGVWEVREMKLRAELEWDYHNHWMKIRPIIEHERVDKRIDGSGPGVGSHSLIWGDASVPVLTTGRWSSFWRLFRSGWVLRWALVHYGRPTRSSYQDSVIAVHSVRR